MSFTYNIDLSQMEERLQTLLPKVESLVQAVLARQASVSEGFMRTNARWKDQTGNARSGLHGTVGGGGGLHTLTLAHGVSYGIWLEVRWAGRYAIIMQAVQQGGQEAMSLLERGLARL